MSQFATIQDRVSRALATVHEDSLWIMPQQIRVRGIVEVVGQPANVPPSFQAGEELETHLIHIRRSLLDSTLQEVTEIQLADDEDAKTYRVLTFDNDVLKGPEVTFKCTLG